MAQQPTIFENVADIVSKLFLLKDIYQKWPRPIILHLPKFIPATAPEPRQGGDEILCY